MKINAETLHENKSQAAANKTSPPSKGNGISQTHQLQAYQEMANNSAQVKQLRALYDMANGTSQLKKEPAPLNTPIIQRYKKDNDLKESTNGKIMLEGDKDLYVTEDMKNQANGIVDSQVMFEDAGKEKENSQSVKLTAIKPKVKAGGELERSVKEFKKEEHLPGSVINSDHEKEKERQLEKRKQFLFEKIASENIRKKEKKSEIEWDEEGLDVDFEEDISEEIERLAQENTQLLDPQKNYNDTIDLGGILLPSDCGITSGYVSGESKINGDVLKKKNVTGETPAAGQAYHIEPNMAKETEGQNLWTSHHAAIIMADDTDHVTLESAKHKTTDDFYKLNFDNTWYFKMYGAEEGQKIEDEYKSSFAPGFTTKKTTRDND